MIYGWTYSNKPMPKPLKTKRKKKKEKKGIQEGLYPLPNVNPREEP
jgi:hypothetical protein